MTRSARSIEEAAEWVNRLDQPAVDTSASSAFDDWMDADARNRDAFADMQALWHSDALTRALAEAAPSVGDGDVVVPQRGARWRRYGPALTVLACAAMALFLLLPSLLVQTYRTGTGDGRSIVLADGSHVDLSGNAELRARILPWRREATLVRGEAFFDVRHEAHRPFVVHSDATAVRVLGTAFNVDRQSVTRTVVEVYRGAVALEVADAEPVTLRRGARARVLEDRIAPQAPVLQNAVQDRPDWKGGWFEAADVPMGVLVDKMQRYSDRPIRLDDPTIAAMPVSGRFRVSDPRRVLQAIRGAYDLDIRDDGRSIRLTPMPSTTR